MILKMQNTHWEKVKSIYIEGIKTGNATFQQIDEIKDYPFWIDDKIDSCSIIFKEKNSILGWATLSKVSSRCVYAGVAEVSIYISSEARGMGIGTKLLKHLIHTSEDLGIWTLQAGIFPENEASIRLHKKLGFKELGIREKLGKLKGIWRDVVLLEKRSKEVGYFGQSPIPTP